MLTHPKIPIGEIVYLQDGIRPFGQSRWWQPVFRNPWQILAAAFRVVGFSSMGDREPFVTHMLVEMHTSNRPRFFDGRLDRRNRTIFVEERIVADLNRADHDEPTPQWMIK